MGDNVWILRTKSRQYSADVLENNNTARGQKESYSLSAVLGIWRIRISYIALDTIFR